VSKRASPTGRARVVRDETHETVWNLSLPPEKVCDFILRIREFQVKEIIDEPDTASNAIDDGMRAVLEDAPNDAVETELHEFVRGLNVDEQLDLTTLAWLGRGDGSIEEWASLRAEAARSQTAPQIASYLTSTPMLADYLEEGLSQFGQSTILRRLRSRVRGARAKLRQMVFRGCALIGIRRERRAPNRDAKAAELR
jgi:hypothetical protein